MKRLNAQSGFALVAALSVSVIMVLLIASTLAVSLRARTSTATDMRKTQAFYVAQAGLERMVGKTVALQSTKLPSTVTSNLEAAQYLVGQINGQTGVINGGTFTLTAVAAAGATTADPATITITSQGVAVGGAATRRVQNAFNVSYTVTPQEVGPMLAAAPAALTITGGGDINGAAPVKGDADAMGTTTYTMRCPASLATTNATCNKSATQPDKYTLTYPSGTVPPEFQPGMTLRPTTVGTNQKSEERYMVSGIRRDKDASGNPLNTTSVELTVLSDYIASTIGAASTRRTFASNADIAMRQVNNIPALLMPPTFDLTNPSNNVRDMCTASVCEHYTMSPNDLFVGLTGKSKDTAEEMFKAVPGGYTSGASAMNCSGPSGQWLKLASTAVTLRECSKQKFVIVDARHLTGSSLDLNFDVPSSTFRGLLYIMAPNGMQVKVTGNNAFAGAVVLENGSAGIDLKGNGDGTAALDCSQESVTEVLKKDPKVCYDREGMAALRSDFITTYYTDKLLDTKVRASNWREVGQ